MSNTVETASDIRPFHVDIPDEALEDLRRRIAATNWPEKETVADQYQGVPLAMIQKLARCWMTDYDWRTCAANLNALPHLITEIDGLDIHFIHVRSQHEDALPLIVNHGWPGSIIEQLKIIDRLTDPTAHKGGFFSAKSVSIPIAATVFPASSIKRSAAGRSRPTPTSSTSTKSTEAATSPPGNSHKSLQKRSAQRSDHFGR
jgi:Epoxide hydrolase N terminus